jgi:hypothetical protein
MVIMISLQNSQECTKNAWGNDDQMGRLVEGTKEERSGSKLNVKNNKKLRNPRREKNQIIKKKINHQEENHHQEENQIIKKKIKSSRRKIKQQFYSSDI